MKKIFLLLVINLLILGCSDKTESTESKDAPVKKNVSQLNSLVLEIDVPDSNKIGESPDGEMLPGLSFASSVTKKRDGGVPPTGKDALIKMARKALEKGEITEALAVIDVLALTHQKDPEVLEMRGNVLLKQGLKEDAKADFDRCCALGRQSCCR